MTQAVATPRFNIVRNGTRDFAGHRSSHHLISLHGASRFDLVPPPARPIHQW
jgi:hypothetical protein